MKNNERPDGRQELLKSSTPELIGIESIIYEKKSGYNTAGVLFFLILSNETRTESINTYRTGLVSHNEKVLPVLGKPSTGVIG
jgi:hypothetical protein